MTTATRYEITRYHDQRDEPGEIRLTVRADGEDMNTGGEPCRTVPELRAFVGELCREGFYSAEVRDALLAEADAL